MSKSDNRDIKNQYAKIFDEPKEGEENAKLFDETKEGEEGFEPR
jgi:hypothetical protein